MGLSSSVEKGMVKRTTAFALIALAVILVIGIGSTVGYLFFWNVYDKDSKFEHDFKIYQAKVNKDPNSISDRVALAWSLVELGKPDQAMEQYQQILKLDPRNASARYNVALIKLDRKDYTGARADLESLRDDYPNYLVARSTLGLLYREISENKLAVQEFTIVNDLDPGRVDVMYNLGLSYEKLGDKAKARAIYQEALKRNPSDPDVKKALAAL